MVLGAGVGINQASLAGSDGDQEQQLRTSVQAPGTHRGSEVRLITGVPLPWIISPSALNSRCS